MVDFDRSMVRDEEGDVRRQHRLLAISRRINDARVITAGSMAKPEPPALPRRTSSAAGASVPPVASTGFAPLVPPGTSAGGTEVVLCADFDRYGTRLVTGAADHRLRIYERVEERWDLVDVWRGHNGMVLDVKFSPLPSSTIPLFASSGEDLRLKIWASDPTAPASSGRRFYTTFSQSAGHAAVAYVALAFAAPAMPAPDLLLATVTRDGVLALVEPVPEVEQQRAAAGLGALGSTAGTNGTNGTSGPSRRQAQDWRELDQIYAADGTLPRGTETSFRLAFQPFPTPTSYMTNASNGSHPISLAVASLTEVRIYPINPPTPYSSSQPSSAFASSPNAGIGSYRFGSPLAIISAGNGRLVRDVAWSPAAHRTSAWIAAASADGVVRVYDVAVPKANRHRARGQSSPSTHPTGQSDPSTVPKEDASSNLLSGSFGERVPAVPPLTSTLTASLSRAAQPHQQHGPQAPHSPQVTTSALFPGAPSTAHLSATQGHTQVEGDPRGSVSGGTGAASPTPAGGGPRLDVKLVAELAHQGVWRVAWIRTGAMVISIGDSGQGRVWGPGLAGNWVEFAEFGADSDDE